MTRSAPPSQVPQAAPASQSAAAQTPPALDSSQLLGGRKQVAINHGGELYSLRLTRNGKLILTK
jgi:hemin uptake protein HemP